MTEAYLVGVGQSDYGTFPDESYRSLFRTTFEECIDSVPDGMAPDRVDEAVVGTLGVDADTIAACETGSGVGDTGVASVPTWHRSLPQRHRLVSGRCPDCGAYTFPPEGACRACNALVEFEAVELQGTGTLEAYTEIGKGGAPPEFAELQSRSGAFGVAIVAFDTPTDGDATAPAMVVGDASVGDRVEAIQRRIYTQEGVTRYGFKVRRAD